MSDLGTADTLEILCAILRENSIALPRMSNAGAERIYAAAREHGVHLLLAERLSQRGALNGCPSALRDRLLTSLRNQVALEEIIQHELRVVLAALADRGVVPLLFKGTALAFTHYREPALRPRVDTDLLIDSREIDLVRATFEQLGYGRLPLVTGDLVMYQTPFGKTDRRGVRHTMDVHWKISNPQIFAAALTAEELRPRAVSIPALGIAARAAGSVDSLVLACIHRVAHHSDQERLIWIYDIHLIAERLAAGEREEFIELAAAKQLTSVCRDGLVAAERLFGGRDTGSLVTSLTARNIGKHERSEIFVTGKMRKVDVLASDLKMLGGWRPRVKLVREHLFPSRTYMRQAYEFSNDALLPVFYIWRIARGATKWWRHGRGSQDNR